MNDCYVLKVLIEVANLCDCLVPLSRQTRRQTKDFHTECADHREAALPFAD